jgi:O-antigen/teichoic acid export membrane protein
MLNPVGALLYACGRADVAFRWNSSLTLLSIGSACLGSRWGATGLAASQLTFMIIVFMPAWKLLIEPDTGMTAKSYLRYFVPSLVTSATTVFFSWLLVMHIDSAAHKLAAAFFIGGLIYTLISLRWNSIWIRAVREIIGWDV